MLTPKSGAQTFFAAETFCHENFRNSSPAKDSELVTNVFGVKSDLHGLIRKFRAKQHMGAGSRSAHSSSVQTETEEDVIAAKLVSSLLEHARASEVGTDSNDAASADAAGSNAAATVTEILSAKKSRKKGFMTGTIRLPGSTFKEGASASVTGQPDPNDPKPQLKQALLGGLAGAAASAIEGGRVNANVALMEEDGLQDCVDGDMVGCEASRALAEAARLRSSNEGSGGSPQSSFEADISATEIGADGSVSDTSGANALSGQFISKLLAHRIRDHTNFDKDLSIKTMTEKGINGWEYVDHAVVVVGWGELKNGNKYWVVRNSWGPNWGPKQVGYAYVSRGRDDMAIEAQTVFADPDFSRGAGKQILNKAGLSEKDFHARIDDKDMLAARPFFEDDK